MTIGIQDLCNFFDRMGWYVNQKNSDTIFCLFSGDQRDFLLAVRLQEQWISLTIPHYLPIVPPDKRDEVGKALLIRNDKIRLVKFSLTEGGEVVLAADLPGMVKVNFDLFTVYVDAISYYANALHDELYNLIKGYPFTAEEKASND